MKVFFLSFFFLSFSAAAGCEAYTRFGQPETICWNDEHKAYVSESCARGCLALTFVKTGAKRPESIDTKGGKNPAAQYCKAFELRVHVLKDPRQGEQSFCVFSDGSIIDANAIARSLR